MPDHFQDIYASKAAQYDAMVAREDYQGNIRRALESILPLAGIDVVEFGAGTGRLTRLLAPLVRSIRAYDASAHMLEVACSTLEATGTENWTLGVADNGQIPEPDNSADLVIEGWSFGHATGWNPDGWRDEIGQALSEMQRILKPGGTAILLETLGTGSATPQPPSPGLVELYEWLENERGCSHQWIRTDYQFETVAEAEQLTRFFFGDELANRIVQEQRLILPECTGIWWRRF
jgi:ubiquinone/menaquinone biosynthesis C-methylase UbiE